MQYQSEIDGLRALAVLSVLLFHLGFAGFGGGFVGVDVFFVISGFLITRLILAEVQGKGSISFSNFYERRARRLAPALFFTFAVTFAFAVALFSPSDMQRFSGSLVHAVLSLSNFYFWTESGYFDAVATVKPLLHTWSLSVEEQFYLIWPATLAFLLLKAPKHTVPIVLVFAGLSSLALNIDFHDGNSRIVQAVAPSISDWFSDGPATIFYLAPFRVFEFAIGASLAFLGGRKPTSRTVAELLTLLGLALILLSVMFYSEAIPFPTIFALPPCLGTALIIYFASSSKYCKLVLSHPWLVRLGLISYSLYLIHWPIIVFYTYYIKSGLSTGERLAIVAVSIIAAEMMYRWVETPFRHNSKSENKLSPGGFGLACAMIALVICFVGASAWANQGWPWRYGGSDTVLAFGSIKELERERAKLLRGHRARQFSEPEAKRQILVVGDSLGDDVLISLVENLSEDYEVLSERYNQLCYDAFLDDGEPEDGTCADILAQLESSVMLPVADEVYVAFSMGPSFWATEFTPLINYLKKKTKPGARIVLFGRRPLFTDFHSIAVSMLSEEQSILQVEQRARQISGDLTALDSQMKAAAEELGIEFISSFDIICSRDRCKFFTDDGSLVFWDKHHMTVQGATWFGSQVVELLDSAPKARVNGANRQTDNLSQVAAERASGPLKALPESTDMTLDDAVRITQDYMAELNRIGMDGRTVHDISLLPHPKTRVTAALLMLMNDAKVEEDKSNFKNAIMVLAYFQPDVGPTASGLGKTGPEQQTWKVVVEREKRELKRALARAGDSQQGETQRE
jgi:peptidoglycan/LPS O-acetylase OafA/YrhL